MFHKVYSDNPMIPSNENWTIRVDKHHRELSYLFLLEILKTGISIDNARSMVKSGINSESIGPNVDYFFQYPDDGCLSER